MITTFSERQRMTQWWLWLLILGIPGIAIAIAVASGKGGSEDISISVLVMLLVFALIFSIRLDTSITESGIRYRFFPFHLKDRTLSWQKVKTAYVRQYRPIAEYGGWGLKGGFGNGWAYNVKGNIGLQLELTDGEKILIGTQKGPELEKVLHELGRS